MTEETHPPKVPSQQGTCGGRATGGGLEREAGPEALPRRGRCPARRRQAIQQLPIPNHPEPFARGSLLSRGAGLEVVRQPAQRIERHAELLERPALLRDLAAQREPVERAVLP